MIVKRTACNRLTDSFLVLQSFGIENGKTIDHPLSSTFILVKTSIPLALIDSIVESINASCEGYMDFIEVHL